MVTKSPAVAPWELTVQVTASLEAVVVKALVAAADVLRIGVISKTVASDTRYNFLLVPRAV